MTSLCLGLYFVGDRRGHWHLNLNYRVGQRLSALFLFIMIVSTVTGRVLLVHNELGFMPVMILTTAPGDPRSALLPHLPQF